MASTPFREVLLIAILLYLLLVVFLLFRRETHRTAGAVRIFRCHRAFVLLAWGPTLTFGSIPFWPGAAGDSNPIVFYGIFESIAAFSGLIGLYIWRYKVVVRSESVTWGAFGRRTFARADICAVSSEGGRGRRHAYAQDCRHGR